MAGLRAPGVEPRRPAQALQACEGRRRVRLGRGAQGLAEFEGFAAHAQHEGRRRLAPFGLAIDLQHRLGRQFVRGMRDAGCRRDASQGIRRRRAGTGVDEQREFAADQVERVLDLQLEVLDQFDLPGQAFIFEPFGESNAEHRAQRIVAAARIADGENDQRRAHRYPHAPRCGIRTQ